MELVALLSTGKGSWGQISGLVKRGEWEKIFLVGEQYIKKFSCENAEYIFVKLNQSILDLKREFLEKLKGKLKGPEVALSIASGTGKEHMALISALLSLPVGIKFVALTKDGIIEL